MHTCIGKYTIEVDNDIPWIGLEPIFTSRVRHAHQASLSPQERMCASERSSGDSQYLSHVCVNMILSPLLLTSACRREGTRHARIIAQRAAVRAKRRRRAANLHRSKARQTRCRISSFAFYSAAGSRSTRVRVVCSLHVLLLRCAFSLSGTK